MSKLAVLAIGPVSIDHYLLLQDDLVMGSKIIGQDLGKQIGGMVANFTCNLASEKVDTGIICMLDQDEYFEEIMSDFKKYGVSVDYLTCTSDIKLTECTVLISNKDRTIIITPGNNARIVLNAKQLDAVKDAKFVYSTINELKSIANFEELKKALSNNKLVFDIEPTSFVSYRTDRELFDLADILFINEYGMEKLILENENILQLLLEQDKMIVLTKGANGASVYIRTKNFHVDSVKVEVLDTTGAGDMFNASFLSQFIKINDVEGALVYANNQAAQHTTYYGPKRKL